jgi:large subunit ribosomal protein L3
VFFLKNMKFILGKKIEMAQIFNQDGEVVPVTWVQAGPCSITQIKEKEKDNYQAVQIGFIKKKKNTKKTEKNKEYKFLREKKNQNELKIGDVIDLSVFQEGDKIAVSGISKGKGFQGGVKRWGFKGKATASHGTKHDHRTLGSVGSAFPERVIKGRKMPGRMGRQRKTIKNLEIIKIDKENNLLAIKGALPGARGSFLEIKG